MGCDIHTLAQRRGADDKWETIKGVHPFDWRDYGLYGFLADVRNYSDVPPISRPRGYPDGFDYEVHDYMCDYHSQSWLSVEELLAFDYDAAVEDRRVTRTLSSGIVSGGETCDPGEGEMTTWREFLGDAFFEDLDKLKAAGAERIVFGFDS